MDQTIKVAILDNQQSTVNGYIFRLSNIPEIEVVATMTFGEDLEPTLAKIPTDILLMDVNVPTSPENPNSYPILHIIPKLLETYPNLAVLVISIVAERGLIRSVMEAGASGYILKDDQTTIRDLGKVIVSTANGGIYFSQKAHQLFIGGRPENLTARQLEALSLAAAYPDATTSELALKMVVSNSTFRNLLSGAYIRLGVHTRQAAIAKARELGLSPTSNIPSSKIPTPLPDTLIPPDETQIADIVEVNKRTRIVTDQPGGPDRLNFTQYANAFAELITNPEMSTPITIGIYGHWGSGKSFLMGKIKEALSHHHEKLSWSNLRNTWQHMRDKKLELDVHVIEFNAWVYSGSEHLWASLVTHLHRDIERHYGLKANAKRLGKALRRSLPNALGIFAFYALIGIAISLLLDFNKLQTVANALTLSVNAVVGSLIGGSALASIPTLWAGLREFFDNLFLSRANKLQQLATKPDFRNQIGVMADIKDEIKFIRGLFKTAKKQTRLVLFIDDLDRCDRRKAVEVLQAIMLLLADDDASPFVIFLGIDVRVIISAIEENYGEVLVKAGINGYEYLDKIIQVPFATPAPSRIDIDNYVESLLWASDDEKETVIGKAHPPLPKPTSEVDGSGISQSEQEKISLGQPPTIDEVPESQLRPVPKEISVTFTREERDTLKACVPYLTDNPRKIKRIINIYRLARLIFPKTQDRKMAIYWILMTEQWPLHIVWLIEYIVNDGQTSNELKDKTLVDVYNLAKKDIYAKEMETLLSLDADSHTFQRFLKKEPIFTVQQILTLLPYTFSLNPAIRSEVRKVTITKRKECTQEKKAEEPGIV